MSNVSNIVNTPNYTPYTSWTVSSPFGETNMRTSSSIGKIALALNKAQRNIGSATKGSANPFFKSKYADLGSVMEACKEALNNEGISVLQPVVSDTTGDYVETMLLHESGEFLASRMKLLVQKPNMQEFGSAVSYARRYGLQSMVFIPAEDDDGERTMRRDTKPTRTEPAVAPVVPKASSEEVQRAVMSDIGNEPATPAAQVEPLKKSSFRKPKKVTEVVPAEDNNEWS